MHVAGASQPLVLDVFCVNGSRRQEAWIFGPQDPGPEYAHAVLTPFAGLATWLPVIVKDDETSLRPPWSNRRAKQTLSRAEGYSAFVSDHNHVSGNSVTTSIFRTIVRYLALSGDDTVGAVAPRASGLSARGATVSFAAGSVRRLARLERRDFGLDELLGALG